MNSKAWVFDYTFDILLISVTVDKMNLTCNFQDDFMCGYKVSRGGSASWERYRGEGPNPATSPKADNDGTSTGKC